MAATGTFYQQAPRRDDMRKQHSELELRRRGVGEEGLEDRDCPDTQALLLLSIEEEEGGNKNNSSRELTV